MLIEIEKILGLAKPFCSEVYSRINEILVDEQDENIFNFNGKMLRPSLAYYTALALNRADNNDLNVLKSQVYYKSIIDFATAVELLHSASLVHDDILDDDEFRRGEPTLNKKVGNKAALLSGNILYLHSFGLSLEYLEKQQSKALVNAARTMCYGEITQMNLQGIVECQTYEKIITQKTGILTAISCSEVTKIVGGSKEEIENFHMIGLNLGILYQLFDDIKDKDTVGNVEEHINVLFAKAMEAFEYGMKKLPLSVGKSAFQGLKEYFQYKYKNYK